MQEQNAILVIVAHPELEASRINKRLAAALEHQENITVHKLYEVYPEGKIDILREQQLLLEHQRVVLQFPLFWYSSPPLLKAWMDETFQRGWAHGTGGDKLHGKELMLAVSSGSPDYMYQAGGVHNFSYSELLRPFQQTANRLGMAYLPPYIVSGIREVTDDQLEQYADGYITYVRSAAPAAMIR
ncbi:General stress protein 14 [Paenibacillus auburnensis]|uniref:General stress protein 14 n=1 Tax=Paenibacillus auburnensis TaxID=2905649 RepID=A0ABN8H1D0_9BACL|nr:NAD(P)H-dependent oxidoreductase [Paenibacillus auburnensis]CAH1220291.1 General stress protein 14 [Paenibacillus auburnensis]